MSKSISFIALVVAFCLFALSINASSVEVNIHVSSPSHHRPIQALHDSIVNHEILPKEQQSNEAEVDDAEIVGSSAPSSNSAEALHINAPGTRKDYTITSYGESYKVNKGRVMKALDSAGLSLNLKKFFLAIAMLETNTMSPITRDKSKSGYSTNYSLWNINYDLIQYTGSQTESSLNEWSGLTETVHILKQAVERLGVNGFLDFLRGGRTGFMNHVSYGCYDYRNAIASMMKVLDKHPTLLTDSRRINLEVEHV